MILDSNKNFYRLFAEQVEKRSGQPALSVGNHQITYGELNERADGIAGELIANDIAPGDIVVVNFRSPYEMAEGIMGVLKAGGTYIPINFAYPDEYINQITGSIKVNYLLTYRPANNNIKFNGKVLSFENSRKYKKSSIPTGIAEVGNLFSVIYSSNSTGRPEGISLSHQTILNWIKFNIEKLKIDFSSTLFVSSTRMEVSFPIWMVSLVTGGEVHFYQPKTGPDRAELAELMHEKKYKTLVCPLSFLDTLIAENDCKDIFSEDTRNIVSVGEEPFDAGEFKKFIKDKNIRWHNYYGFPGIHMITTLVEDRRPDDVDGAEGAGFKHSGKLAPETRPFILDRSMQLVSIGTPGELYVSGKGVMDEYYQNEQLNTACYLESPGIPDTKLYKTGYKACWLPDGKISLFGRTDNLVNINGYPIAVEEVESVFLKHPSIDDCAVVPQKTSEGILRLTAYLLLKKDTANKEIEEFLENHLPVDVMPIGFVRLSSIPYTSGGFPDRVFLGKTGYPDTLQLRALESEIKEAPGVEDAAVIVKEETTSAPRPLHLWDFVPELKKVSAGDPGELPGAPGKIQPAPGEEIKPAAIAHGAEINERNYPQTLVKMLEKTVKEHGDKEIIYVQADGSRYRQTYASLLKEAESIAAGLRKLGLKPRDIVIFQFDSDRDYISTFWGCTLAGIVPAPAAVPKIYERSNNEAETLINIWKALDKPFILSGNNLKNSIRTLFKDAALSISTIEVLKGGGKEKKRHIGVPQDFALLLFTSGSTGTPKGVLLTHRNVICRSIGVSRANGFTSRDVSLNWLPLEHVGGIVSSHIRDTFLGMTQVHTPAGSILQEPIRWVDLVDKYKISVTWSPNFAFDLINNQAETINRGKWDLSSMRFIINAGEAVVVKTVKRFMQLLRPHGLPASAIHPAFGMSETSSGLSYSKGFMVDDIDEDHKHVSLGPPIPGTSCRITDDHNRVLDEGSVGHIQVKGKTIFAGYYNNPLLTEENFTHDGWFKTGDLGLLEKGCLVVTGRAKDVIIINGINYNNGEIESVVEEVEGVSVSYTAACAVRDLRMNTDQLILFYNSRFTDFNRLLEQVEQIRQKCIKAVGINPGYVIPLNKEEIPKTSIGKIQRSKLVRLFAGGEFDRIVKQIDIARRNENTLPPWFFKKTWRKRPLTLTAEPLQPGNCLVFHDASGLGNVLVKKLEENNCTCITVKAGDRFKKINRHCYEIDEREPGHYDRLLEKTLEDGMQIGSIFHLFGCDSTGGTALDTETVKNNQYRVIYSVLSIIPACEGRTRQPTRLLVVGQTDRNGISAFLKSVSITHSWLTCSYIHMELASGSISASAASANAGFLLKEWQNPRNNSEVAFRKGVRWVPHLCAPDMEKETSGGIPVKNGGIYLVTGGLGGIGTYVCRWLLQNFRAKLIITGRTHLPGKEEWDARLEENTVLSRRIRACIDIESISSDFVYLAGDICSHSFLDRVKELAVSRWGESLSGVFHLAGVPNPGRPTRENLEYMFYAKVFAALNLHQRFKDDPDFLFVAFSSVLGFFGASNHELYSAANGFLDDFCLARRGLGFKHTYCLAWSAWEKVGMSENTPSHILKAGGYREISPQQGLNSMAIALKSRHKEMLIGLDGSNPHIKRQLEVFRPGKPVIHIYYSLKKGMVFSSGMVLQDIKVKYREKYGDLKLHQLQTLPRVDGVIDYGSLERQGADSRDAKPALALPRTAEEITLARVWQEILGKEQIGINDNFFELGGTSLKATVLVAKIHKVLNIEVPLGQVFKTPTISQLSEYVQGETTTAFDSIPLAKEKEYYPLSSAQKRLYFLQQLEPDSTTYNVPQTIELEGQTGKETLEEAFKKLIKRHESLRTSFEIIDSEPVQKIHPEVEFTIEYISVESPHALRSALHAAVQDFIRPFDLSQAPLLRVGLIRTGEAEYILATDMHHIIADGLSYNILIRDVISLYKGEELPVLRIQYKDYSEWQNHMREKGEIKKQEEYWIKQFEGEIPVLDLPADYSRPDELSFEGSIVEFDISEEETGALEALAQEEGATMYMAVLALFNILLWKLTGREDIIVGTDTAGRRHADLENIIGMFVNTLVLRNYPEEDKTFTIFLREVKQRTLEAFENQDYQFENLVEKVVVKRDASRNPLFDIMFTYYNMAIQPGDIPGLKIKQSDYEEKKTAKFDLIFHAAEIGRGIHCTFEYSTKLFKEEKIKKYTKTFKEILSAVIANKEIKLKDIPVTHGLIAVESNILLEDQGEFGF